MNALHTDRRLFMAGLAVLAGCGKEAGTPVPPGMPFADAHVHLFNASDLPVDKFLGYVVLPSHYPTAPTWALALVHMFATFYRPLAVTVADERKNTVQDWNAERFGVAAAAHIQPLVQAAPLVTTNGANDAAALSESYRALLSGVKAMSGSDFVKNAGSDAVAFVDIAQAVDRGVDPQPSAPLLSASATSLSDLIRLIGWGYLLLQSRDSHAQTYLKRFAMAGHSATLLINHLVDYDMWLGEGPAPGSSHLDQILLMDEIAQRRAHATLIRTFAGYCPLKHAVERQRGGEAHFDRLKRLAREGRIAGFKLYPPMGFRSFGNSALDDAHFQVVQPGRHGPLDAWKAAGGNRPLGRALDDALAEFYRFCVEVDLPLMAHAAASNGAGPDFALRAHPDFWQQAVATYSLRLNLGHLVADPRKFVDAVNKGGRPPADVWALQASTRAMLQTGGHGHQVYGDLAYSPELIASPTLATAFFRALKATFEPHDPDLSRILYGTDWVMFGQESNSTQSLSAIMAGMETANLTTRQQDNILSNNVRRFLKIA